MTGRRPRTYRLPEDQLAHLVGVKAGFHGDCNLCPDQIDPEDRVVRHRDGWIHARCAPGQDES